MPEPRDPVDAWLNADVELLPPGPQAFERIAKRARRRKMARAVATAAGAAVIVTAAVTVPRFMLPGGGGANVTGPSSGSSSPTIGNSTSPTTPTQSVTHQPGLPPGSAIGNTRGIAAPAGFKPTSVTFISAAVGAVIGQAARPCFTRYCTSLAGTSNYGGSWYGVSAPVTGPPNGSTGVSELRFLNGTYGWAFGPALWFTTDGGKNWSQSQLTAGGTGPRVTSLETTNGVTFALAGSCAGTGPDFAAQCHTFTLYRAVAGRDTWVPVPGATNLSDPGGGPTSGSLVLVSNGSTSPTGGTGYLLAPDASILSGGTGGGGWRRLTTAPCLPGSAQADGQPAGALLTSAPGELIVACAGGQSAPTRVYTWRTGRANAQWRLVATIAAGVPESIAAQPGGVLVMATNRGIEFSANGGASWRLTQTSPPGAVPSGFSYVGMTTPLLGVAMPADAALGEVYVTTDGGAHWRVSKI